MKQLSKYIYVLLALIFLSGFSYAVFFPSGGFQEDKAREKFQKGLLLYNDYHYAAAIPFFVDSLSHNPEFLLARRMLGQAFYFSGQVEEALGEWQNFFDLGGYDPMLSVHIQNIRSAAVKKTEQSSPLVFSRLLQPQAGYRYQFPTYIGLLPNQNFFLTSSGGSQNGNLIVMNNGLENTHIVRRINGRLEMPVAAVAHENELWISDYQKDKVHRMTLPHRSLFSFWQNPAAIGTRGSDDGQFLGPAGICHYGEGFYVVDSGNHRIQKFNDQGEFLFAFSKVQDGFSLDNPFGLACSSTGEIYVSEPEQSRISVFDAGGNFSYYLGENFLNKPRHLTLNKEENILAITDETNGVFLFNLFDQSMQNFKGYHKDNTFFPFARPYASTFDSFGNLFVADYGAHHLVQFASEQALYSNLDVWIERIDVSSFPLVALWISVKDYNGRAIDNLKDKNFVIDENDSIITEPSASYLQQFDNQSSSVILLARNQKMQQYSDTYDWLFDFIYGDIREKDKMKLLSYSQTVREDSPWTNSRLRLRQAYRNQQSFDYQDNHNQQTGKALYQAVAELLPAHGQRSVLWVTDGLLAEDAFSEVSLEQVEAFARNNHIAVYVLSYENPDDPLAMENKERLIAFSQKTGGSYFSIFHDNLTKVTKHIRQRKQERYVLTYRSAASTSWKDHYMDVKVMVNFLGQKGSEVGGYFVPSKSKRKLF